VCEAPLLTVDRQMGLNIVHPEGKVFATILAADGDSDDALVSARKDNI
jgi:hypothetical protein